MSDGDIKDLLQMIMTCSKNLDAKLTLDSGCCKCLLEYVDKLEQENFNLREGIYIEKMSFPSEGRNFKELMDMPTYQELQEENRMLKQVNKNTYESSQDMLGELSKENQQLHNKIDKAIEYIESKNNGVCIRNGEEKGAYTFLLDFDKAREFVWSLLEILKDSDVVE